MTSTNAVRDENSATGLTVALNTDGLTPARVLANSSTHRMMVSDGSTGSDNGPTFALHDENDIPTALAASSSDGKTPVVLYADSSGNLLIKST